MRLVIPPPSSEATTRVMKANRGRDTKPELALRKALWVLGARGYRVSYKKAPGRPDIAFPKQRVAVFCHGCFWHRCEKCNLPLPKSNVPYWREKFKRNKERDQRKIKELESSGWRTFVFWECDLKRDPSALAKQIVGYMDSINRK